MRITRFSGLVLLAGALAGCATYSGQTSKNFDHTLAQTKTLRAVGAKQDKSRPPVTVENGDYFGTGATAPLAVKLNLPEVFRQPVTLVTQPLYLYQFVDKISVVAGLPVALGPWLVQQEQTNQQQQTSGQIMAEEGLQLSLDYQGDLKGLLDTVADHFGIAWRYTGGQIEFFKYEARIYTVDLLPGAVQDRSTVTNESSLGTGGSGTSGGTSANSSQTVSTMQNVDMWKSLVATVKGMLTQHGVVSASEDAGTLTVVDTPATQSEVASYIKALNARVGQQVAVTVKIYSLDMNTAEQSGFNLGMAFKSLDKNYGIIATGATPVFPMTGAANLTATILSGPAGAQGVHGQWIGSTAVVQALSQYGKVSLVTQGSGIAMQGQPMPIQITTTTGYLASSSSTISGLSSVNTSALQPGQVTTGYSIVITPRILPNNNIVMQYVMDLSNLISIQTISSGGQEIQVPNVASRRFIQRVMMHSGSMLVLAGYEQTNNQDQGGHGLLSWFRGTQHDHQIIFVTIAASVI